jgi:hypothetical protein
MAIYFSIITGEIYDILDELEGSLDTYQLKLFCKPKNNCKQCYGRFHISFNPKLKIYNICPACSKKCLVESKEINVETPIQTTDIEFADHNE